MADLLQTFPQGEQASKRLSSANLLDNGHSGGLLQQSAQDQEARRQTLLDTNKRSTSYGLDRPLLYVQDTAPDLDRRKSSGFKGGMYNTGTGGLTPQASQSQSNLLGSGGGMDPQVAAYYAQYQNGYGFNPYGAMAYGTQPAYGYGAMGPAYGAPACRWPIRPTCPTRPAQP